MQSKSILLILLLWGFLLAATQDSIIRAGACATPGICWNVFVRDNLAYVADRGATTVADISNPSGPWIVSSLSITPYSWALGLYVQDTVAYLNWTGLGTGFSDLSVADPSSLYVLGSCHLSSGGVWDPTGVMLKDTIVYLATGNGGVMQINVSNPSSPDTIKAYNTPGLAMDLVVKDTLVYVADVSSLQIISFADPLNPYLVGSVPMPNTCCGIFVVDSFAYATCESSLWSGTNGSLQVVNVSHPESPHIAASIGSLRGDPLDIWISGNYAYVAAADHWFPPRGKEKQVGGLRPEWTFGKRADVEGGLRVVDISNPLNPTLRTSYDTPGDPRGVFAVDTLVFVADYDSLQILRHSIAGIEETTSDLYLEGMWSNIQPNPFTDFITIQFKVPSLEQMHVRIFDATGKPVKTFSGHTSVLWYGEDDNGTRLPGGVYFVQVETSEHKQTTKVILLR